MDCHDGEDGLCGVGDGKEHDEDKLEDKVKGAALDDEHHCTACNALTDVKRGVGDSARGGPDAVNNERGNDDICAKGKGVCRETKRNQSRRRGGRSGVDREEELKDDDDTS